MAELTIAKAQTVLSDHPIPDIHIHISGEQPEFDPRGGLAVWGIYWGEQAELLELALYDSLPGGTYDRLLGRMLARKATHFRGAFGAADA